MQENPIAASDAEGWDTSDGIVLEEGRKTQLDASSELNDEGGSLQAKETMTAAWLDEDKNISTSPALEGGGSACGNQEA